MSEFSKIFYFCIIILSLQDSKGKLRRQCLVKIMRYEAILKSTCFVDKTLLIKDLFAMEKPIVLATAPRRTGKTVILEMLKNFLQITGGKISVGLSSSCKLLKSFNVSIYNYENSTFFYTHCGQHPVIYIKLSFHNFDKYLDFLHEYRIIIHQIFLRNSYLLHSPLIEEKEKDDLTWYTEYEVYQELPEHKLRRALVVLSRLLQKYYNRTVTVLVDNFDQTIIEMTRAQSYHYLRQYVEFIDSVMTVLLSDHSVARAFIVTTFNWSKLFLQNVNYTHVTFQGDHSMAKYLGLTSDEVSTMLKQHGLASRYEEVEEYYAYKSDPITMYNTWSIMNYIETPTLRPYWIYQVVFGELEEMLLHENIRRYIAPLVHWKQVTIQGHHKVSIDNIVDLNRLIGPALFKGRTSQCKVNAAITFVEFLLDYGFFYRVGKNANELRLAIPNKEIQNHLYKSVYNQAYFEKHLYLDEHKTDAISNAFNELGLSENKKESLLNLTKSLNSVYEIVTMPDYGDAVQGSVYWVLSRSLLFTLTEAETGKVIEGRQVYADIITVRDEDSAGIVIETKYRKDSAKEALQQIFDKGYHRLLDEMDDYKRRVGNRRIYIGLYYEEIDKVKACYLINSEDLSSKICV